MAVGSPDPLSASWADLLREKRSLAAIVRDAGRLCVMDSVDLVLDICDELANAHANGIVHGDLGLHRARTMWPRRPGDHVDIFALGEEDTAAFEFKAAFSSAPLAPEQRAGRMVDHRADIWAVGAILHALVGGVLPSAQRPVREALAGAPRALIMCVESCLAENPEDRPRSVDDIAGALASFSSSSPERFQQLARRRMAQLKAKHAKTKVSTLARLDDAALLRESARAIVAAAVAQSSVVPDSAPPTQLTPAPAPGLALAAPASVLPGSIVPSTVPGPAFAAAPAPTPTLVPPAPATLPTVAACPRPQTIPPPDARPATRPSYSDPEISVSYDASWPQLHGAPSLSLASAVATAPEAPPTATALTSVGRDARKTAPMFDPKLYRPTQVSPAYPAPSPTPAPIAYDAPYDAPPSHIPTPAPAVRGRAYSHHPPSFGAVVVSTEAEPHLPAPGRMPSFGGDADDLAQFREAKRASRMTATIASLVAAAVIAVGLGYGGKMIERDRAAAAAAAPAAAAVPAAPAQTAAAPAKAAPTPAASSSSSSTKTAAAPSATPATKAASSKRPVRSAAPAQAARKAPAAAASDTATAKDDRPDVAASTSFSDALGKKEAASPTSLSDALK